MTRWANEERWDDAIVSAANNFGVPADLVRAVISHESQFRPTAMRPEPAIGDASIGLMQILLGTARGEGYSGSAGNPATLTGLYDPLTNITYGTSYLARQYERAGGSVPRTLSAYNGGWRPEYGFGTPAAQPVRICLAKDINKKCVKWRDVKIGEFGNQAYVNTVLANYNYFRSKVPPPITTGSSGGTSPPLSVASQPDNESETDWRVGGTPTRTPWARIRETLKRVLAWFKIR